MKSILRWTATGLFALALTAGVSACEEEEAPEVEVDMPEQEPVEVEEEGIGEELGEELGQEADQEMEEEVEEMDEEM